MTRRLGLFAGFALLIGGCVASPAELAAPGSARVPGSVAGLPTDARRVVLEDGSEGWEVFCANNVFSGDEACRKRAAYICPKGYADLGTESRRGKTAYTSAPVGNTFVVIPMPTRQRVLTIRCNGAEGPETGDAAPVPPNDPASPVPTSSLTPGAVPASVGAGAIVHPGGSGIGNAGP